MTRTLPALAALAFAAAAFVAPAAEACISCEYVPPVVNTPVHSFSAHCATPSRSYAVRKHRARKIERARAETKHKKPSIKAAKKVAPVEITPAKETKAADTTAKSENKPIDTASIAKSTGDTKSTKDQPATKQASNAIGCKKFFASVGMTLSVPCE
jgi:hypothetical protein